MKPRILIMTGLLITGFFLAGCRNQGGSNASSYAGTYTLATINGQKLPCTPPHEGGAPEVRAGTLTLNADGTFKSAMSYAMPSGKLASRDFSGTYTSDGPRLRLKWKGAGTTVATINGNTFTMDNEGVLFA